MILHNDLLSGLLLRVGGPIYLVVWTALDARSG
jgi:hypothetical protein